MRSQILFPEPDPKTRNLILSKDQYFDMYVDALMLIHDLLCEFGEYQGFPQFTPEEIRQQIFSLTGISSGDLNTEYFQETNEYHIFLSHSWADSYRQNYYLFDEIYDELRKTGLRIWKWGLNDENRSHEWPDIIANSHCLVVVLTPNAKAAAENVSGGVYKELSRAIQYGIRIFPLLAEGSVEESVPRQIASIPVYNISRESGLNNPQIDKGALHLNVKGRNIIRNKLLRDINQHLEMNGGFIEPLPEGIKDNIENIHGAAESIRINITQHPSFSAEQQFMGQQIESSLSDQIAQARLFILHLQQIYSTLRIAKQAREFNRNE